MKSVTILMVALVTFAAGCGGSDDSTGPATTAPTPTPAQDTAGLQVVAEAALRQVELGGLRGDLGFTVADSLFNATNSCAAVIFSVDIGDDETIISTAYMVRTAGRTAAQIFPRAEVMQPAYLAEWDGVVGSDEWGLLALAPPETDVDDVVTVCSDPFLEEALRRHFAVQIEPE